MAKTLEELIILKKTALKYLLIRESRLLALGKRPINKKIASFIKTHQENTVWSSFLDSLNEDLTRNINVFEWKTIGGSDKVVKKRSFRLDSVTKETLRSYEKRMWGGRMDEAPVVTVEQGQLQGKVVNSPSGKAFYSFQGIPYAKPPLGSLRFKDPQPAEPWEGIRDATTEGNVSQQVDFITGAQSGDENCLFLNVYTPNLDGSFLPVMVWIHGGGFRMNSGNSAMYGADFLVEKDVVVVTLNYRLGPLGFLCLNTPEVPGNAGLKDQAMALKWVKDNVQNFGGNPGNVTIFGQSAGAISVSLLTASPMTKGLISKAIVQSAVAISSAVWQDDPLKNAKVLARQLGCDSDDADDILNFLQATSAKDIVEASEIVSPFVKLLDTDDNLYWPVIEREFPGVESFVNESFLDMLTSGRVADIPIMNGFVETEVAVEPRVDDLSVFIPKDLNIERGSAEALEIAERIKQVYFNGEKVSVENWNQYFGLVSDGIFGYPHHRYVKILTQVSKKPVYYYHFAYVGGFNLAHKLSPGLLFDSGSAAHSDELGYIFRTELTDDVEPTAQDLKTRERMVTLWTNFAKTGNPTPEENSLINITWQPVTKDTEYYLNIGSELSLGTNLRGKYMQFWDEVYQKNFKIWEQSRNNENGPTKSILVVESGVVEAEVDLVESEDKTVDEVKSVENEARVVDAEAKIEGETIAFENEETTEEVTEVNESETVETLTEVIEPQSEVKEDTTPDVAAEEEKESPPEVVKTETLVEATQAEVITEVQPQEVKTHNGYQNGDARKTRPSNEIKMVHSNGAPRDVIRANDPPEDDLPKNIGVNKFVNFFESLGGKK